MPDYHPGRGCVIGLPMLMPADGIVNPNFVGLDISCSILAVTLSKRPNLSDLDDICQRNVPSGFYSNRYRYRNLRFKLLVLHKKPADVRNEYLHKGSARLVINQDVICEEELKIKNMTKSAKRTTEEPGRNVKQKSGLNREILKESWSMFFNLLSYKLSFRAEYLCRSLQRTPAESAMYAAM